MTDPTDPVLVDLAHRPEDDCAYNFGRECDCSQPGKFLARLGRETVIVDGDCWPWPGNTRLPWQVWNEVPHPDGMTVYDPDGFRFGKPRVVTWAEFELARGECTLVAGVGGREEPR